MANRATRLVGGSGEWRVRTGDYRIAYEIEADRLLILILVLRLGHRREIYQARQRREPFRWWRLRR